MAEAKPMNCNACGHSPPADSVFCNQCGMRLLRAPDEPRSKQRSYTPKHLVERVLTMRSALEGERKQVTVLFVDVQGSVAMSEQVNPEVWHQIMDRFFMLLSDGIHSHEGTINQYTGDGVMALFGAPIAHEDHARRGCLAALNIRMRIDRWSEELLDEYGIEFKVRMGLNSGEVVVGRIGDDLRMDYTARGHTVGLAARMESMAKPGRIYLSQFTAALVKREFELKDRGDVRIKGVSHRVKLFELRHAVQRSSARFKAAGGRTSPWVGRWEEMAILDSALERAQMGEGQVVCLTGAPGLGKSRLCYEFAEQCRERQIPVYSTRGVSHYKAAPLAPFVEFARSYFGVNEEDDSDTVREKLTVRLQALDESMLDCADVLHDLLRPAKEGSVSSEHQARMIQLLEVLGRMVQVGVLNEPSVIIIENLQWLMDEPQSRLLLVNAVQAIRDRNVLIVLTMRPEYRPDWPHLDHVQFVELEGLADRPALAMLDELMGKSEQLEPLKRLIIRRSGGNPLFMEELLGALLDEGTLEKARDGLRLKATVDESMLPAEVQAVVAARLDRLAEADKRLLQIASVIGKRFREDLLLALADMEPDVFQVALQRLLDTGWVYKSRTEVEVEYAFHQSLVRDVAYHSQLAENRSRIHRAIAEHLSRDSASMEGAQMGLTAHHFAEAGDLLIAASWEARAAEWYGQRNIEVALRHWQRLMAIVPDLEQGPDRCRISLQAHARVIHLGAHHGLDPDKADALIDAGWKLTTSCDDPILIAYFLLACGGSKQTRGDIKEGLDYLQQAEEVAAKVKVMGVRAAIRAGKVHGLLNSGQIGEAQEAAAEGLDWLRDEVSQGAGLLGRSPYLSLLMYQGLAQAYRGDFKAALQLAETALEPARSRGETQLQALGLIIQSLVAGERGHSRKALGYAREAHALCKQAGNKVVMYTSVLALGRASLLAGNLGRAQNLLEEGLKDLRAGSVGYHEEPRFILLLARVHLAIQDFAKARALAREAIKLTRRRGMPHLEADAHLVSAEVTLAARGTGAGMEARDALKRSEKLIEQSQAHYLIPRWHLAHADLAELRSDSQLMQQALESAVEWLEEAGAKLRVKKIKTRQKDSKSVKLNKSK